jgi:hypothetical protein
MTDHRDPALPPGSNIYELTARESAWIGLPQSDLLIEAFKAIIDEKLPATFDQSPSTAMVLARSGATWRGVIHQAISALERNPHFFVRWFRSVMVDHAEYRRFRNEESKCPISTQGQRPRRPSDKAVLAQMREHLNYERAQGRMGSQKRAWEWAKNSMPGARYQQIIKALRVLEGGRKGRGRPREQSKSKGAS